MCFKNIYVYNSYWFFVFALFMISCKNGEGNASSQNDQQPHRIVVAKDGSGDFTTVQQAIDAAPGFANDTTVIFIKNGVYKERITVPASKKFLKLVGENADHVILTYDNYAAKKDPATGKELGTSGSASFYLYASDFMAENITFQNSYGRGSQALAIYIAGDRVKFVHCRFLGFQDTIFTGGKEGSQGRQYFKDCYIAGATDFIFGHAIAVFDHCTLFCKAGGHYITAASTPEGARYGYVFLHCKITGDAPDKSVYLGRTWRPYAKTVYLYCSLSDLIIPAGWSDWGDTANDATAFYAEYKNKGPGADTSQRVTWSFLLSDEAANQYILKNIFNDWKI